MGSGVREASAKEYLSSHGLLDSVRTAFANLKTQEAGNLTAWMDLIRTCRQPQIFWEVDYIEPKKQLAEVNSIIREFEQIYYPDKTSITLLKDFSADLNQQAAFNTVRVHLHAENGDFDTSLALLRSMLLEWQDDLSVIRQSNLLFHSCLAFLCCGYFEESYDCFSRHWGLMKYSSSSDRVSLGIADNDTLLRMAYWFFIKHVEDFRDFFSVKSQVKFSELWNHKKISILYFLEYDNAWVASLCSLAFYNHARDIYSGLPAYEKKRSTPTNINKFWANEESPIIEAETGAVGEEKYYYEQFNRLMLLDSEFNDPDKVNDYIYSYYHYQNNYADDINKKVLLSNFILTHLEMDDFDSVVEVGCGLDRIPVISGKRYLGINISEKICSILKEKGIEHIHSCAATWIQETDQRFDLCYAYDLLNHLTFARLRIFLESCSKKCRFLAAMIDTREDIRTDIISNRLSIDQIDLHPSTMPPTSWLELLQSYFSCSHAIDDRWLYVFGKAN